MKPRCFAACSLLSIAAIGAAATSLAQGKIHSDPAESYGFKPHQLPFETPTDEIARTEYESEPFYAIILQTPPPCSVSEQERLRIQALLPQNKVFATRFGCEEELEENITYTNVNDAFGFVAVYAGATLAEARQFLEIVEATGEFPGANIRKMQAVLVYP